MISKKTQYNSNQFIEYHYINALVILIIALMFVAVKYDYFSVHCIYSQHGGSCKTCGLTSAFRKLLKGTSNNVPLPFLVLFVLFSSQLVIRPAVSLLLIKTHKFTLVRNLDAVITIGMFVYFLILLG